jgi:hypothetical protein
MDNAMFVIAGIAGPDETDFNLTECIEAKEKEIAQRLSRFAEGRVIGAAARDYRRLLAAASVC